MVVLGAFSYWNANDTIDIEYAWIPLAAIISTIATRYELVDSYYLKVL